MTEAERLALIWEAADSVGDDALLLGVLTSLRDEAFRADVVGLMRAGPRTRQALRVLLRSAERREAANGTLNPSLGDEPHRP
ncbi:hypothetical protein [Parvularcula dongshanensis]|uniref:Uncharacterized protein n=1 Tax=Parvularcula dongshanensis TaxID=1173995 RepID=A0A840I2V0_9PROT|nr:hypothetical protein [Parvularcula dongshanensis]MBB4659336.1 hypothetical protein [Parvularcula dongshanensis]